MAEIKCPSCWNKNVEQIGANEYRCPYCGTTFSVEPELPVQEEKYDAVEKVDGYVAGEDSEAGDNAVTADYNKTDDGVHEEEVDDDHVEGNTILGKIAICCFILACIECIGKIFGFSMIDYPKSWMLFGGLGVLFSWLEKKWNKG